MTITIEIPEDEAAVLEAKAVADGVTIEEWFQRLVKQEMILRPRPLKSAYGILAKYGPGPSAEEIDENRRDMFKGFGEDF